MKPDILLPILLGRRKLFFWTFFAVAALGILVNFWIPKQYTSHATVLLDNKSTSASSLRSLTEGIDARFVREQVAFISSYGMALRVVDYLGLDKSTEARMLYAAEAGDAVGTSGVKAWLAQGLLKKLRVHAASDSNVLEIEFTSFDARLAAAVVDAFVQTYGKAVTDNQSNSSKRQLQFVQRQMGDLRESAAAMEKSIAELQQQDDHAAPAQQAKLKVLQTDLQAMQRSHDFAMQRFWQESFNERPETVSVITLHAAEVPDAPSLPKLWINLPLSLLLGLILGAVVALLAEVLDRRVRTEKDAAEVLGLPVLATVAL